jgi:hypothetical protein
MIMKKEYIVPEVETIHLNLNGSILEDFPIGSGHTGRQGAKGITVIDDNSDNEESEEDTEDSWNNQSFDQWK